ncbi:MAG: hypothetical protein H6584_04245 [Flavobacteriales bacterium]|nr:hypothetical protein [Flavobacteriales bacterium]
MEKSIENIWKEGFLKEDLLIAPKINNLYSKKSLGIVQKFHRMFKINIIVLFVLSIVVFPLSIILKISLMGAVMSLTFLIIALYSLKISKEFKVLEQNVNSYEYLKSFDDCLKKYIKINGKLARYFYPILFAVTIPIGFGYGYDHGVKKYLGGDAWEHFQNTFSSTESSVIFLIQIFIFSIIIFTGWYYGEKIYLFDLKLTYGKILKKLDQTLADMEELRQ